MANLLHHIERGGQDPDPGGIKARAARRRRPKYAEVAAAVAILAARWPAVFGRVDGPRLPLRIGVHVEIADALATEVSEDEISAALHWWTAKGRYLAGLAQPGAMRHGLDGTPVDPVSEAARQSALAELAAAERRVANQRKVVEDRARGEAKRAAAAAKAAAEAEAEALAARAAAAARAARERPATGANAGKARLSLARFRSRTEAAE